VPRFLAAARVPRPFAIALGIAATQKMSMSDRAADDAGVSASPRRSAVFRHPTVRMDFMAQCGIEI